MTGDKFYDSTTATEPVAPVSFVEEVTAVRASPTLGKLAEALAKAQMDFEAIKKESENPAYARGNRKSKYADLHSIIDATRWQLAANGLVLMQFPHANGDKAVTLTSRLQHVSNEYIETDFKVSAVGQGGRFDIQTVGSAITYASRYALQSILNVAAEEDDDGNAAAGVGTKEAATAVGDQKIKDLEAAKRAKQQGNGADLSKPLQDSIASAQAARPATNGHGKPEIVQTSLEAAKDDGLFDEISGTIQTVKQMQTSAAKGSRPYRKITITTIVGGKLTDVELSAFENFKMSDGTCFAVLDADETIGSTARFVVERNGKYVNLKDIKQLGKREWDARLGVIQRDTEPKEKLW